MTIATGQILRAQDLQFSQYQSAPMHLNPAMAGMMHDLGVISVHYRSQWQPVLGSDGAFKTYSFTYENRRKVKKGLLDFSGYGIGAWRDNAGAIQHTQGKLAINYARMMIGDDNVHHYLVGGGDFSLMQRRIDITDRRWVSQYDGSGGWDPTRKIETIDYSQRTQFDVSIGLAWLTTWHKGSYMAVGASIQHLNRADYAVLNSSLFGNLYTRTTLHADGEWRLKRSFGLMPSILFMQQGPSMQITPGAAIRFIFKDDGIDFTTFRIGAWWRIVNQLDEGTLNDAVIGFARVDWRNVSFGFSYDFNMSSLKLINPANNAVEMLLSYRFIDSKGKLMKMITPRYL